jgi:hypothetical protein
MRRIFVDIADEAFDTLAHLALRDRRNVRAHAAVLLERATATSAGVDRRWRNGTTYDPASLLAAPDGARSEMQAPA